MKLLTALSYKLTSSRLERNQSSINMNNTIIDLTIVFSSLIIIDNAHYLHAFNYLGSFRFRSDET